MKKIFQRLAIFLAVVVVATLLGPASEASAATKMTLSNGKAAPTTIYTGKSCTLKVPNTTVVFYSSNKKVATVGWSSGKVVAKTPGKVTITAKAKTTRKVVATHTFTVNQRATSVAADVTSLNLGVGESYALTATKTPATSTDVIRFYSSNKSVATVSLYGGKVNAISEGTARITIYSKATKATSNNSTYNKVAYVDVTVKNATTEAVQVTPTQIKLTLSDALTFVNTSEFSIKDTSIGRSIIIRSAELNQDNKKEVNLYTFDELKDGKTYTVTYGTQTFTFKATDGKVANLAITPVTAYAGEETAIKVIAKDANGVVIGEYGYGATPSDITFEITYSTNAYLTSDKLVLLQKGVTATAKATYHTYKFDNAGNELGTITTGNVTIVAVEKPAATVATTKYTLGDITRADFNSSSFVQNSRIAVDETKYLSVKIIDSNNKEITNYYDYTVESSNPQVLLVNGTLDSISTIAVYPVAQGSASILVKNANGAYVAQLPVTVIGERKASSVVLDKTSFTLSNSVAVNQTGVSTATLRDQFGDLMKITDISVVLKNASTTAMTKTLTGTEYTINLEKGTVTFYGAILGKGVYQFEVSINGQKRPVQVEVKEPSTTQSSVSNIMLGDQVLTTITVDSSVVVAADVNERIPIRIVTTRGGVLDGYQTIQEVTVNNGANNDLIVRDGNDVYFVVNKYTLVNGINNAVGKTASGTYELVIKSLNASNQVETRKAIIVVKDTQPTLVANQKTNRFTNSSLTDTTLATAAIKESFEFTVNGVKLDNSNLTFDFANSAYTQSSDYLILRKLKVYVSYPDIDCAVEYNLELSKTITFK